MVTEVQHRIEIDGTVTQFLRTSYMRRPLSPAGDGSWVGDERNVKAVEYSVTVGIRMGPRALWKFGTICLRFKTRKAALAAFADAEATNPRTGKPRHADAA